MKTYLLAGLLLCAAPAIAQTATHDSASVAALDAKYGFRKYIFGTPLSSCPGMQKRGKHYIDPLEFKSVGGADLGRLEFYFYEDKLCSVLLTTSGTVEPTRLFSALVAQYGSPTMLNDNKWAWAGKRATITFTQQVLTANIGYIGIPVKSVVVTIDTNEALARRTAAEKKRAQPLSPGF